MIRVRVIEKGVNDQDGNRIEKGTEIEISGNTIPAWLLNKVAVVSPDAPKDGPVIVNPSDVDAEEKKTLAEYAAALGIEVDAAWTLPQLKSRIAKAEKAATK